jgi:hypothetical protein
VPSRWRELSSTFSSVQSDRCGGAIELVREMTAPAWDFFENAICVFEEGDCGSVGVEFLVCEFGHRPRRLCGGGGCANGREICRWWIRIEDLRFGPGLGLGLGLGFK